MVGTDRVATFAATFAARVRVGLARPWLVGTDRVAASGARFGLARPWLAGTDAVEAFAACACFGFARAQVGPVRIAYVAFCFVGTRARLVGTDRVARLAARFGLARPLLRLH